MGAIETDQYDARYAARRERFNRILAQHRCGAGAFALPNGRPISASGRRLRRLRTRGAADNLAKPGRFALVLHNEQSGRILITNLLTREEVPPAAEAMVAEGWAPVCFYDLDVIVGAEPPLAVGDRVDGGRGTMSVTGLGFQEGRPTVQLRDGTTELARDVKIVKRLHSKDQRLPERYDVADVTTRVTFNTVAASAEPESAVDAR